LGDDLAGIGVCRADPEIDVFGRSRVTVSGQRMSADQKELNCVVGEFV